MTLTSTSKYKNPHDQTQTDRFLAERFWFEPRLLIKLSLLDYRGVVGDSSGRQAVVGSGSEW